MQDINDKINNMHMGKLIHMLSHEMKRNQPIDKVIKAYHHAETYFKVYFIRNNA